MESTACWRYSNSLYCWRYSRIIHSAMGGTRWSVTKTFDNFKTVRIRMLKYSLLGNCMILVEKAGPATTVESITLVPNDIRGMTGHLINDCVAVDGLGGFGTRHFGALQTYIASSATNYLGPFRKESVLLLADLKRLTNSELLYTHSTIYFIYYSHSFQYRW